MNIQEAMAEVVKMAAEKGRVCYLYPPAIGTGFRASFEYWNDWLFKAYPGGRKVLSVRGKKFTEEKSNV